VSTGSQDAGSNGQAPLGSAARPLRVAVVGSGPSGFFSAQALFKAGIEVRVDLFERLPTPYGLVRLGVAPDHQKIKSVSKVFERIAAHEHFRYWGHVDIGRDLSVEELRRHYDAVLFAQGAATDRRLGIPGEDLPGSHTATAFVAWYNGHPDYADLAFDLSHETVAVIGQGNVAVDVCRILAKTPDELRGTDIAGYALEQLAESKVRTIYMIGRRGPVQAKFTHIELLELDDLADARLTVDPAELELEPASWEDLKRHTGSEVERVYEALKRVAYEDHAPRSREVRIVFRRKPVRIVGDGRVEGIELERSRLVADGSRVRAEGTGEQYVLPCGLVFRSVGYQGVPMSGLPFDDANGVIPNNRGRILDGGAALPGLYTAGWIKRGATGVIGTNRADAKETVDALLEDVSALPPCPEPDSEAVHRLLEARNVQVFGFAEWARLDREETALGEKSGKIREKFVRVSDMLHAASSAKMEPQS
jgi:ferredoxin/flavodoxin---NADP+ reductase